MNWGRFVIVSPAVRRNGSVERAKLAKYASSSEISCSQNDFIQCRPLNEQYCGSAREDTFLTPVGTDGIVNSFAHFIIYSPLLFSRLLFYRLASLITIFTKGYIFY